MLPVAMRDFVDFTLTPPAAAVALVRASAENPPPDHYRPVREAIVDMHEKGLGPEALDNWLLRDSADRRRDGAAVKKYQRFLGKHTKVVWFTPPMRDYPLGPIAVRVAPELGLFLDGRPHAISLYLRSDPITPSRVKTVLALLRGALGVTWPGTVFSVLDVRRAKLYAPEKASGDASISIRAAAAAYSVIAGAL